MTQPEHAREFYRQQLAAAVKGPASTGYGLPVNQKVRFDQVWRVLETIDAQPRKFSILDVGCGTGDMLRWLEKRFMEPERYLGIDLMPEMIAVAHELLKQDPAPEWGSWGFLTTSAMQVQEMFDVVCSVAALAHKEPFWSKAHALMYVTTEIRRMAARAKKALVVTLFSDWKTDVRPDEMVMSPGTILEWALMEFDRVELIHSYAPHDFTLIVYMETGEWWKVWRDRDAVG